MIASARIYGFWCYGFGLGRIRRPGLGATGSDGVGAGIIDSGAGGGGSGSVIA